MAVVYSETHDHRWWDGHWARPILGGTFEPTSRTTDQAWIPDNAKVDDSSICRPNMLRIEWVASPAREEWLMRRKGVLVRAIDDAASGDINARGVLLQWHVHTGLAYARAVGLDPPVAQVIAAHIGHDFSSGAIGLSAERPEEAIQDRVRDLNLGYWRNRFVLKNATFFDDASVDDPFDHSWEDVVADEPFRLWLAHHDLAGQRIVVTHLQGQRPRAIARHMSDLFSEQRWFAAKVADRFDAIADQWGRDMSAGSTNLPEPTVGA